MDITRVRLIRYSLPFRSPYVTAAGAVTHREGFVVELAVDSGLIGLGEASLLPHVRQGIDALEASLRQLGERAAGADMAEFGGAVAIKREAGWPAFSMALTDAVARARGNAVASLFPEAPRHDVNVNALIDGRDADAVAGPAATARARGFTAVKLKVGMVESVEEERARVAAAREAIGDGPKLRLDANGAWAESRAIEMLRVLVTYDIEYIEQPVAPRNLDALRRVREAGIVPVAADEDAFDAASAEKVLEAGAADVLIIKPLQFSGIGAARATAARAHATGVDTVVTTSIDSGVGTALALQLAASLPGERAHGLATLSLLENDLILEPGLPVQGGRMHLPDAPGLGVELDEGAIAKYGVGVWEFRA